MNDKLAARRIGRALFEIDNALWHLDPPQKGELEEMRLRMGKMMNDIGYEFAKNDSPVVRRRTLPYRLTLNTVFYTKLEGKSCVGETQHVPHGTPLLEIIRKNGRGARSARWLVRLEYEGHALYGWIDRHHLTQISNH